MLYNNHCTRTFTMVHCDEHRMFEIVDCRPRSNVEPSALTLKLRAELEALGVVV